MKFNLNDFMQLDTKALLAVNGGTSCGGSSGGSSGGGSYSRNHSSWSNGGGSNRGSRGGGGSCSGSSSGGISGGGGNCGGTNNSGSASSGVSVSTVSGGGNCSKFDLTPFIKGNNSDTDSASTGVSGAGICGGTTSPSAVSGAGICGGAASSTVASGGGVCGGSNSKTSTEKIMDEVSKKGNDPNKSPGEKEGCYKVGSYQCDEYVEEMIKSAGYNPKDYYVDNPHGKTVDKHISELKNSGKSYETDATKLTAGSYVVFMSDNDNIKASHAGLLFVNSDGSAYMYDNSSHNFNNGNGTYSGGIQRTNGYSPKEVCNQYSGYENFYFQKLN